MDKHMFSTSWIGSHRDIQWYGWEKSIRAYLGHLIYSFEQKYSRFLPDSLVSQLNSKRFLSSDDRDLFQMLQLWEKYREKTAGYFSLFVGSALEELGYGKKTLRPSDTYPQGASRSLTREGKWVFQDQITLKEGIITLSWNKHIDLGGIGKGYLIDNLAKYFQSQGITRYMINGGGDILIAQDDIQDFWRVWLQHPLIDDEMIWSLELFHAALAGSGTRYRKRQIQDWFAHHLIDPHTGKSADNSLLSVFVTHSDSIIADIMATTLFVMPIDKIEKVATDVGVEFCLVFDDMSSIRSKGFGVL